MRPHRGMIGKLFLDFVGFISVPKCSDEHVVSFICLVYVFLACGARGRVAAGGGRGSAVPGVMFSFVVLF